MANKNHFIFLIVLIIGLASCNKNPNEKQVDNTKPMYGEVTKNWMYKQLDDQFKAEAISKFKTIDSAVNEFTFTAWRYFYNNDLLTSMKRFNQVWLLNPEYPDSYFGFAALMEMQKNDSEAERFYKIGFEKDKKKVRAIICLNNIARCKVQIGDTIGSIDTYSKLLKLYPNDTSSYISRGFFYQTLSKYNESIADFTKAISIDSKNIRAYCNRSLTYFYMSDFLSAKKDLEICIKFDPKDGGLRRMLGLVKLYLDNNEGACKDFYLAKQLGDTVAERLIEENCK